MFELVGAVTDFLDAHVERARARRKHGSVPGGRIHGGIAVAVCRE